MSDHDPVKSPSHYAWHPSGIQPIEISRWCSFNIGTAINYIWRHAHKGQPVQDLRKAAWHLRDEAVNVIGDKETLIVSGPLASGIEFIPIRCGFSPEVQVIMCILWMIGTRSGNHNEHDVRALVDAAILCEQLADRFEATE